MTDHWNWKFISMDSLWEEFCYVLTGCGVALIRCGTSLCSLVRNFCYTIIYMVTCPLVTGNMTQVLYPGTTNKWTWRKYITRFTGMWGTAKSSCNLWLTKFEVYMVVTVKITVFWNVMVHSLVDCYQHFRGTGYLHLQDRTVTEHE